MRKRLTKAAHCAIVMRSKELNKQAAIVKLQEDLLNGPLHRFGYHTNCNKDFCKTAQRIKEANTQHDLSLPSPESLSCTPSHSTSIIVTTPSPLPPSPPVSPSSLAHSSTPTLPNSDSLSSKPTPLSSTSTPQSSSSVESSNEQCI